jgi:hypothetical protein
MRAYPRTASDGIDATRALAVWNRVSMRATVDKGEIATTTNPLL